MFSNSEDIECIHKYELLELIHLNPSPDYFFNRSEWSEADIIWLFEPKSIQESKILLSSIRADIHAKTLRFTRFEKVTRGDIFTGFYVYFKFFFDPFIIYDFVFVQGLKWPESVIEWHDQKLKLKQAAATQIEQKQTNPDIDVSAQIENQAVLTEDTPIYERRKKSCDNWVEEKQINLKALEPETVHDQLKQIKIDKNLWTQLKYASFLTEFWHKYSHEKNLNRQRGRPKKTK